MRGRGGKRGTGERTWREGEEKKKKKNGGEVFSFSLPLFSKEAKVASMAT